MSDVFIDVENKPVIPIEASGTQYTNSGSMAIGQGSKVFRADQSGIWLGAEKFVDAPFSVDMEGNVIATSATFSAYSKIRIFAQDSIPTSVSIGDLWFDTNDYNKAYRAASVGADQITAGEWVIVDDQRKVSVFAQDGVPTSLAVGDLWIDTNDSNKLYRAASIGADAITAGEWVLSDDQRAADALLKSGASQTFTGDFSLNDSNVKIDGANKRILINDGTNNRILLGYQSSGF